MRAALRKLVAAAREELELRDAFVFGGLGLALYGVAQVYAPAAWIAAGGALFWLGIRKS